MEKHGRDAGVSNDDGEQALFPWCVFETQHKEGLPRLAGAGRIGRWTPSWPGILSVLITGSRAGAAIGRADGITVGD